MANNEDNCSLKEESSVITKELLETAIRLKEGCDDIYVKDFSLKPGTVIGENYASVTFRAEVTTKKVDNENIHNLFIKVRQNNPLIKEWSLEAKLFEKEREAYANIVRDMANLQKERGIEMIEPPVPQFYYSVIDDSNGIIILEDLRPKGYILADRVQGLTYEQCKIVMKNLAIFHSLSYAMKTGDRDRLKKYTNLFQESFQSPKLLKQVIHLLDSCLGSIKFLTDDPKLIECAEKLHKLDFSSTVSELLAPEEPFAVICHGDMWSSNILFKYEEADKTKPVDVKLIDLQIVRYSLPVTDLVYFFFTSTTKTIRRKHLSDLLYVYHSSFMDSLKKLNLKFEEFTFTVLERQLKEKMLFGVLWACIGLPGLITKTEDVPEFTGGTETEMNKYLEDFYKLALNNPDNISLIKERLLGAIEDAVEMELI